MKLSFLPACYLTLIPPSCDSYIFHPSLCPESRDTDRRPTTPACWMMGTNKVKKYTRRKIIFCTKLTRAAKQDKNLLYWHDESNEPTKEGPLSLYSSSPHPPQFQKSAGATPSPLLVSLLRPHMEPTPLPHLHC
jgi:hypothetical protein